MKENTPPALKELTGTKQTITNKHLHVMGRVLKRKGKGVEKSTDLHGRLSEEKEPSVEGRGMLVTGGRNGVLVKTREINEDDKAGDGNGWHGLGP